jgi:hypothetical protein
MNESDAKDALIDALEENAILRKTLRLVRDQVQADFAIRCRCDLVTRLPAGIERCVGCRARDLMAVVNDVLGRTEGNRE